MLKLGLRSWNNITSLFIKTVRNYFFSVFSLKGIFPLEQTGNTAPFYKKFKSQGSNNYHPVFLLALFRKSYVQSIFHEMFKLFDENGLMSSNQPRFEPGSSCIKPYLPLSKVDREYQLIDSTHLPHPDSG